MEALHVYDTTLRDGAQQEGLNLSVSDKLAIAGLLDDLGVDFIEGGWPGANPKDTEFFERARTELHLRHATLAAFGATRRAGSSAAEDPLVAALLDARTSVVCLVAKSHVRHVEEALRTTLEENLEMVRDTVSHLVAAGKRVFLDAEHFFDGWHLDREYALAVVRAADDAGAEVIVLCDTNGGMLPHVIEEVVADVIAETGARVGAHCHNDTGCAVANSIAAVRAGAIHVQGTVNGYGERTGNADLVTVRGEHPVQAGPRRDGSGLVPQGDARRARDQRGDQCAGLQPPALRRRKRLRAQGGPPRERTQGGPEPLPAHGPRARRQRNAHPRLRHGGAREHRAQSQGGRARAVGPSGHRRRRAGAGEGSRAARLDLRCCRRDGRAHGPRGLGARVRDLLLGGVLAGHDRLHGDRRRGRRRRRSSSMPTARGTSQPARATARSTPWTMPSGRRSRRPTRRSRSSS